MKIARGTVRATSFTSPPGASALSTPAKAKISRVDVRAIAPIAGACPHARYATGAAGPSAAATSAGRRKIPPPTVTFTIPAARPQTPIARRSAESAPRAVVVKLRLELRVHRDLGLEELRDRAAGLGGLG